LTQTGPSGSPVQTLSVSIALVQLGAPHGVLAGVTRHFFLPSQTPSLAQGFNGSAEQILPAGGGDAAGTDTHRPAAPTKAQVSHELAQSLLQQTPSTHCPESQSSAFPHVAPSGAALPPHRPLSQLTPFLQLAGSAVEQVKKQRRCEASQP
jgi:hypothetical protein